MSNLTKTVLIEKYCCLMLGINNRGNNLGEIAKYSSSVVYIVICCHGNIKRDFAESKDFKCKVIKYDLICYRINWYFM